MTRRRLLKEAWHSLVAARQRTVLALIGIAVGIGSVIAMVSVGAAARAEAEAQFRDLGTDLFAVTLYTPPPSSPPNLCRDVLARLPVATRAAQAIAPVLTLSSIPSFAGAEIDRATPLAVSPEFFEVSRTSVAAGRILSRLDSGRRYAVLGAAVGRTLTESLTASGEADPIGRPIALGDRVYTIIGILEPAARSRLTSYDIDTTILIPLEIATRATREDTSFAIGRLRPGLDFQQATTSIRNYLAASGVEGSIETTEELVQQMERQTRLMTLLLGAIAAISLIVGGVGVMNVMLSAVAERRREIGLLRALGARRGEVQGQFLIESLILGIVGGLCGVGLGISGALLVCRLSGWPFAISPSGVVIGVVSAAAVGVFFGSFPAQRAARIHPMLVLRGN